VDKQPTERYESADTLHLIASNAKFTVSSKVLRKILVMELSERGVWAFLYYENGWVQRIAYRGDYYIDFIEDPAERDEV
jgi:hypothetical protein